MANWKWCLVDESGTLLKGWQSKDDKWYYLNENGIMQIGWLKDKDSWYYLNKDGDMAIGWLKYKDKWYYFDEHGIMLANCTSIINGKTYTFYADGSLKEEAGLISDALVNFVKSYEGFSAIAYDDSTGIMTIGYGTTRKDYVALGNITEVQATQFLKEEINAMAKQINSNLSSKGVTLSQNQFDALCSFAYNCGTGALFGSVLYKRILNGVRDGSLKDNFTAWSKAGGRTMQGLLNRRIEEYQIFANADYMRNL